MHCVCLLEANFSFSSQEQVWLGRQLMTVFAYHVQGLRFNPGTKESHVFLRELSLSIV